MKLLKTVKYIVVHCAATQLKQKITLQDFRNWHVNQNGWDDIGYHYFVDVDGAIRPCRDEKYQGAHEPSVNSCSIGIVIAGGYNGCLKYPYVMLDSLAKFILDLKTKYPNAIVDGHNRFSKKSCPNFDVPAWWQHFAINYEPDKLVRVLAD